MRILRYIVFLAFTLAVLFGKAAEVLWDFVDKKTISATEIDQSDPNRLYNDMGYVEWYGNEVASGSDYHVISTGISIEQVTWPDRKKSTTITPNGMILLTYDGRVGVADYGQVINRAYFETLAPNKTFNVTWDPNTHEAIPSMSITSKDNWYDVYIGYLVFEDKFFDAPVGGYAWVEYSLFRGDFTIRDSGLVYGGDSSIKVGTHEYTYVDPTPEPTGGILILVGSTLLLLRRKARPADFLTNTDKGRPQDEVRRESV